MDEKQIEILIKSCVEFRDRFNAWWEENGEKPPETPIAPPVDAKRVDRIWKYLQAFIPKDIYAELREWAVVKFGYKFYGGTGKYPIDLRTAVCEKLSTFTESQIAELEKILEAEE